MNTFRNKCQSRFNFSKDKKNQDDFYLSPILCSCSRQPCSLTSLAAVTIRQHEVRGLRGRGAGQDGGGGAGDGAGLVGVRVTSLWVSRDRATDWSSKPADFIDPRQSCAREGLGITIVHIANTCFDSFYKKSIFAFSCHQKAIKGACSQFSFHWATIWSKIRMNKKVNLYYNSATSISLCSRKHYQKCYCEAVIITGAGLVGFMKSESECMTASQIKKTTSPATLDFKHN